MFLRTTRVKRPDGTVHEYIRLVESDWNHGRPRHRVICNLGRKELLAPHAEAFATPPARKGKKPEREWGKSNRRRGVGLGVMLVARHFWQELGLQAVLDSLAKKSGMKQDLADRALALVTNRPCKPSSEHGLARWLETDFVCDRWGAAMVAGVAGGRGTLVQPAAPSSGQRPAVAAVV